ncbi:MAG: ribonuclease P protein component [Planctomycetota bacterium]
MSGVQDTAGGAHGGSTFPKRLRLLKPAEFERVFSRKRSRADGMIILYACEGEQEEPRLGMAVSRKVGNAVRRNRWKRCLREAFRLSLHELPPRLDLIVIPQRKAEPDVERLRKSLRRLSSEAAKRLGKGGR